MTLPAALRPNPFVGLALLLTGLSSPTSAQTPSCQPAGDAVRLPTVLRESSGAAWSLTYPSVLWSHNDSGHPASIYAVDTNGRLLATLPLAGARNRDWEDMATGPCGEDRCIYLADTGDNMLVRNGIVVFRVKEPLELPTSSPTTVPLQAEAFPMRLPSGPRDVEALFVLPDESLYLVSKGRGRAISIYRYPPPLRQETVTLEHVQTLTDGPVPLPAQVTGADASPDGRSVVLRTYFSLSFFRPEDGRFVHLDEGSLRLTGVQEAQGEGVAFGPGGSVALTSEAGNFGGVATLNRLNCQGVGGL